MAELRPIGDRVMVLADVAREQTDSGLFLVQDWNPDTTGVVAYVGHGPACPRCGSPKPPPVEVGEHVVYSYTAGTKVTFEGQEYLMLKYDDILGRLEET